MDPWPDLSTSSKQYLPSKTWPHPPMSEKKIVFSHRPLWYPNTRCLEGREDYHNFRIWAVASIGRHPDSNSIGQNSQMSAKLSLKSSATSFQCVGVRYDADNEEGDFCWKLLWWSYFRYNIVRRCHGLLVINREFA